MSLTMFDAVSKPYYFGMGGIGDFLLLMSTFYDGIENNTINVFFVANNPKPIKELSKLFPKVKQFFVFPRLAFDLSQETWGRIKDDSASGACLGTGVTPKNFHYVVDWIKCGQTSNVFDYYGVTRHPRWAQKPKSGITVIQPYGGADDPTKLKEIPCVELQRLISDIPLPLVVTGSKQDYEKFQRLNIKRKNCDVIFVIDLLDSYNMIQSCSKFIGADSWGKTLAGLSGLAGADVTIYPNQYMIPVQTLFGHGKDPSDYVFLDGWGFDYANR